MAGHRHPARGLCCRQALARRGHHPPLPPRVPRFYFRFRPILVALLTCAFALLPPSLARAQEIHYVYDDLGRLVGVVDPQGNAAEYVYDAVGNILKINRFSVDPNAAVAITMVSPNRGRAGTKVQIFGRGFSTTLTDNQVAFNGVAATITAATGTSLTTEVPATATTGFITVTTPLGIATSPQPFTVLQHFAVVPEQAAVGLNGGAGFQAVLDGTPTTAVTWQVNGVVGGNASLGTITAAGLYTAPAQLPPVSPVSIEAVLTADPTQVARATVRVTSQIAGLITAPPVTVGVIQPIAAQAAAGPVTVGVSQPAVAEAGPVTVGVVQPTAAQAAAGPVTVGVVQPIPAEVVSGPLTVGITPALGALALSAPLGVTGGPTVTGMTPATAPVGSSGLAVTVTGANLQGTSAIQWLRNGLSDATLTASGISPAPDGTAVTFTLTISATAPLGPRVGRIITPQGTSTNFDLGTNTFTVTQP